MSALAQPAASPARLAQKAAELVEQCQYDLACKFLTRALEQTPGDATLLDALADVYLMLGNVEAAAMLLEKSARVAPDAGAAKWLSLGQLRHGEDAAACYQRGVAILNRELAATSTGNGSSGSSSSNSICSSSDANTAGPATAEALASAHCSIVELYMTDLCDKEGAEACCEENIARALEVSPNGFEANAMAASLRLVQQRREDATRHIDRAIAAIMPSSAEAADSSGSSSGSDDEMMAVAAHVESFPLPLRFSAASLAPGSSSSGAARFKIVFKSSPIVPVLTFLIPIFSVKFGINLF